MTTAPATMPLLDVTILAPWVVTVMNPAPDGRPDSVTVEEASNGQARSEARRAAQRAGDVVPEQPPPGLPSQNQAQ